MHRVKYNTLQLDLTLTVKSPLLIKAGGISADPSLPDMQFVRTSMPGKGESVYLPGSSLKGVIRSYCERILRTKKGGPPDGSCNLFEGESACDKRINGDKKEVPSYEIYNRSCRACKMFGNTSLKSRVFFIDSLPKGEIKTEVRHGVAISRLTHAVAQGPFDVEVLVSGVFQAKILMENFELWQLGLLSLAINALNEGFLKLGFGKNRGFGEIEPKVEQISFTYSKKPSDNEIWGIGKLASQDEREKYGLHKNDCFKVSSAPKKKTSELFIKHVYEGGAWPEISSCAITVLQEVLQ
jgi:CRISPR-associated RAMP protein (TIGR02581 family)